jgi:hypothetical protein
MILLAHQDLDAILLEPPRGPVGQLITSDRSGDVAHRFYVRYAWLVHVSMEVVDEHTDWILSCRNVDGSYVRGLHR